VALFYLDASALAKLVRSEPQSAALRTFLDGAEMVSSELVLTELPRAIRRAAASGVMPVDRLLKQAAELLDAVGLLPLERDTLIAAGMLPEPALRSLDAIHVATAVSAAPLAGFVTYDERQSAAARLCGLRTIAPAG
jgi:predicted nucleic acid-binding protein